MIRPRKNEIQGKKGTIKSKNDIIISNYCKKLNQLQMLIYHFNKETENIHFQREFLHNFFNPRINDSIQKFRDHITKMQKTALEDYDFIAERTDRFYARKYRKLQQEPMSVFEMATTEHTRKEDELNTAIREAMDYINNLMELIEQGELALNKRADEVLEEMKARIKAARENGRSEIDDFVAKCEARNRRFEADSDEYRRRITEEHELMIARIESNASAQMQNLGDGEWETYKKQVIALKSEVFEYKVAVGAIKRELMDAMMKKREKVKLICSELNNLMELNAADVSKMYDKFNNEDRIYQTTLDQFANEREAKRLQHETEMYQHARELDDMKERLRAELERAKRNGNDNNSKYQAQCDCLAKSLSDNRKTIELSYRNGEIAKKATLDSLQSSIEEFVKRSEAEIIAIRKQLCDTKSMNSEEAVVKRQQHAVEIDALKQKMNAENRDLLEKIRNRKSGADAEERELRKQLTELQEQRSCCVVEHERQLAALEEESNAEIGALDDKLRRELGNCMESEVSKLKEVSASEMLKIEERKRQHEEECNELRARLEHERIAKLKAIEDAGFSTKERTDLQNMYQKNLAKMQEEMRTEVPFVQDNFIFSNMEHAYNDLKKELEDRKCRIIYQRNKMTFNGQQNIEDEITRHQAAIKPRSSNRARESVRQNLMTQLNEIKECTHNECNKLSRELASLVEAGIAVERRWNQEVGDVEEWFSRKKPPLDREIAILSGDCSIDDQERMFNEDRQRLVSEIESAQAMFASQTDTIKRSMKMSENWFERERGKLTEELDQAVFESSTATKSAQMAYTVKTNNMMEIHNRNVQKITQKLSELRHSIASSKDNIVEKWNDREQNIKSEILALSSKMRATLSELQNERETRRQLYDEKIETISYNCDKMKCMYIKDAKAGRPCDLDKIERLQAILQTKNIQLSNAVKDITQYRSIYIAQEKQINRKFNGMPDVGVLQLGQHHNISVA